MKYLLFAALLGAGCTSDTGFCGDGIQDPGEDCDDGNNVSNDGCSATCRVEGTQDTKNTVTANWDIKTVGGSSAADCPPGFDTTALYNQEIDPDTGSNIGAPVIDLFTCASFTGTSDPLPAATHATYIAITTATNSSQYATSTEAIVDLSSSDKTYNAKIYTDGGFFQFSWNLTKASNGTPIDCSLATSVDGIESVSTDTASSSNFASDIFTCSDGIGITSPFVAGTYTVSIDALDSNMQAIGTAPALTNKVIVSPNKITDLGTVTIPITGL